MAIGFSAEKNLVLDQGTRRQMKILTTALKTVLGYCVVFAGSGYSAACFVQIRDHGCLASSNPSESCRVAIDEDALDLQARLALCQVHIDADELEQASVVVRQGLAACGKRDCSELKRALSNVDEKRVMKQRDNSDESTRLALAALRSYCLGPIANSRSIAACEEFLVSNDRDAEILFALGSKQNKRGRPAIAIQNIQRAIEFGKSDSSVKAELASARRSRKVLLNECFNDNALDDCDASLIPGTSDEAKIQRQRGRLLANAGQFEGALRAFIAAASIQPNNEETATLVLALDARRFPAEHANFQLATADAHSVLGNTESEVSALETYLVAVPTNRRIADRLGRLRDDIVPTPATEVSSTPATQAVQTTQISERQDLSRPVTIQVIPDIAQVSAFPINGLRNNGSSH